MLGVGATNRVDLFDDALLRPGRFDDTLEVPLLDNEACFEILRIHTANLSRGEEVNLEKMVRQIQFEATHKSLGSSYSEH